MRRLRRPRKDIVEFKFRAQNAFCKPMQDINGSWASSGISIPRNKLLSQKQKPKVARLTTPSNDMKNLNLNQPKRLNA